MPKKLTGKKYDNGKIPLDLFPAEVIFEVSRILQFGAKKYAPHNWREGMQWSRLYAAALGHLMNFWAGNEIDNETGLLSLAHAICDLSFLLSYQLTGSGEDDRYRAPVEARLNDILNRGRGLPK